MNIIEVDIRKLNPAKYNPKIDLNENDKEYQDIKNSIMTFGYIEPIVVNKDNTIIGGHQRYKVLKDLKFEKVQCVVVDLNKNDEKILNVALNKIQGKFDDKKLFELLEEIKNNDLDDFLLTGFDELELNELEEQLNNINFESNDNVNESNNSNNENDNENDNDGRYSRKIKAPNYIPTMENQPELKSLLDVNQVFELLSKIEKINCDDELKKFLEYSAYRFLKFNYENIAEYYSHANKEIQEIFEDLALVIIDFDKAIEKGFIEFNENILNRIKENEENEHKEKTKRRV